GPRFLDGPGIWILRQLHGDRELNMGKKNAKRYDPAFKARVALEAVKELESLAQIGQRYGVHPVLVGQWKKQLLGRAAGAFTREGCRQRPGPRPRRPAQEDRRAHSRARLFGAWAAALPLKEK